MTNAQIELLKQCVLNLRDAEMRQDELVEVGTINGVHPKTAESLVDAGILVYDMPSWANIETNSHVRFPTLAELNNDNNN